MQLLPGAGTQFILTGTLTKSFLKATDSVQMAPVNRPAKQIISYEEAYPLKQTKTIKQDRHCNFWKRTLQALKKIFLAKDSPSKIRDYTLQTISYVRAESECNSEDVESISKQLEERYNSQIATYFTS